MELITLDGNYQPANLVEKYSSLIWTERYFTAGDFELTSTDIGRMISLLPLESIVSLRESTVPMLVESHKIEKPKNSAPLLRVKGRSFETVLERRVAVKSSIPGTPALRVPWVESNTKPSNVAYIAMRKIIGDKARLGFPLQAPIFSAEDGLPMIDLTRPDDYDDDPLVLKDYEIKPGQLYPVVLELTAANHHGIKSVRPPNGGTQISIEIYNGRDLRKTLVFDARFDQFDDATYLLSKQGSFNDAYVFTKAAFLEVEKNVIDDDQAQGPAALDRRVLYLDVSNEGGTFTNDAINTRGLIELYKHNVTALFDGQISEQLATMYNIYDGGYVLGDIIRLVGEYGLSEIVRVAEFIRSDDNTGSKAYPTFEIINEDE